VRIAFEDADDRLQIAAAWTLERHLFRRRRHAGMVAPGARHWHGCVNRGLTTGPAALGGGAVALEASTHDLLKIVR
jgi:hypothetical protein